MKHDIWAITVVLSMLALPCLSGFISVALGPYGGIDGGATTAFLLAVQQESPIFVSLDAGCLVSGVVEMLRIQDACGEIPPSWMPAGPGAIHDRAMQLVQDRLEGALVTHAHLDHTAGLVMASPDLNGKLLVGSNSTLHAIAANLFNNMVWPSLTWPSAGAFRNSDSDPSTTSNPDPNPNPDPEH